MHCEQRADLKKQDKKALTFLGLGCIIGRYSNEGAKNKLQNKKRRKEK